MKKLGKVVAVLTGGAGAISWLVIAIGLFIMEIMTTQLISVWFGVGALAAIIPAFLGAPFALQLVVFLIISVAVLFSLRPIAMKKIHRDTEPTNADRVIGMIGIVTEEIDNLRQTGRVTANGLSWTARSVDDDVVIAADEKVRVRTIEGVKLMVEPITEKRKVEV